MQYTHAQFIGLGVSPKAGFCTLGGAIGVEADLYIDRWVVAVDYLHMEGWSFKNPGQYYTNQVGVFFGRTFGPQLLQFHTLAGAAKTSGVRNTGIIGYNYQVLHQIFGHEPIYGQEAFNQIGFVAKAGIRFIPSRVFSMGLDLQTNLNKKQSIGMVLVSLQFGLLREPYQKTKKID